MKIPIISIIVAMDEKRGIGKNDRIPWHIKEDLVRLRDTTKDHYVILGRKSYDSMAGYYDKSGRPMPAKEYIVVTSNKDFKSTRNNTFTALTIEKAIERAKKKGEKEVFIMGGASIYKQMIDLADRLYLTIVKGNFNCDTFFPDYSKFKNVILSKKTFSNSFEFIFKIFDRV